MTGSRPVLIALIVSCASFMQSLDGTVITTALPQMALQFGVNPVDLGLGITAYLMTVAVLIPVSGWIADRFGARSVFASAMVLFTLASLFCGMSQGLASFVAARVLQGIGGSLMLPVGQMVLLRGTEKRDLVRAITIATTPGLFAPVLGPPLGGFITTYIGWPWIFYLNLPIGVIGVALILWFLPNPRAEERRPFDTVGFLLNAGALGFLIYGLSRFGAEDGGWLAPLVLILAGVALGVASVLHARSHPHPIVSLSPLRFRSFTTTTLTAGLPLRIQVRIMPFVLPLLFQVGFGMTAFMSGVLFLAHTGGDVMIKTVTTRLLRRFGFRTNFLVCTVLFAASIAACGLFTQNTPYWVIFTVLLVSGAFRSPIFTGTSTLAYADVPPEEIGGATALVNLTGQFSGALGVSLAALVLNLSVALRGEPAGLPTVPDFQITLFVSALIALVAIPFFLKLAPDSGAEVSGHRA